MHVLQETRVCTQETAVRTQGIDEREGEEDEDEEEDADGTSLTQNDLRGHLSEHVVPNDHCLQRHRAIDLLGSHLTRHSRHSCHVLQVDLRRRLLPRRTIGTLLQVVHLYLRVNCISSRTEYVNTRNEESTLERYLNVSAQVEECSMQYSYFAYLVAANMEKP